VSLELAAGHRQNSQAGTPALHELAARTTWHLTDLAEAHGKQELNDFKRHLFLKRPPIRNVRR